VFAGGAILSRLPQQSCFSSNTAGTIAQAFTWNSPCDAAKTKPQCHTCISCFIEFTIGSFSSFFTKSAQSST
jgi:hypothetical protein